MQDQMRLGGAQKLWTFKRSEPFLPQIHNTGAVEPSQRLHHAINEHGMANESQSTYMTQMKRIKHDEAGPLLEVRSPHAAKEFDKPGTHHGY